MSWWYDEIMQTQQYIRSTVNLPVDIHKKLKIEALNRSMTFSAVILDKLRGTEQKKDNIKSALLFFKKLRQNGPSFDGVEAIRKNRDLGKIWQN